MLIAITAGVNKLQYCSIITTRAHAWCHAVFRMSNAKVSRGNTDFHETRHGIAMR